MLIISVIVSILLNNYMFFIDLVSLLISYG